MQCFPYSLCASPWKPSGQVRTAVKDWRSRKDLKRREMVKEYYPLRMSLNGIRKNDILPKELQEIADKEIHALPRDSSYVRVRDRCMITSRPRAVIKPWRLGRHTFRKYADGHGSKSDVWKQRKAVFAEHNFYKHDLILKPGGMNIYPKKIMYCVHDPGLSKVRVIGKCQMFEDSVRR